jgi:hypothetical protein
VSTTEDYCTRARCLVELEKIEHELEQLKDSRALPHVTMAVEMLRASVGLPERPASYKSIAGD